MEKNNIEIAILTKNRYVQLTKSVNCLLTNSTMPYSIIIVDSSNKVNYKKINKIKTSIKKHGIKLIYKRISDNGVGHARNMAISFASKKFLSFIDDDEYVPSNWIKNVLKTFYEKPEITCLTGPVYPNRQKNYWNKVWDFILRKYRINGSQYVGFAASGNSTFNLTHLRKYHIKYSRKFRRSSEDKAICKLLNKKKLKIFYSSNIFVHHDFRLSLKSFSIQWFYYGYEDVIYLKHFETSQQFKIKEYLKEFLAVMSFWSFSHTRDLFYLPGFLILELSFGVGFIFALINWSRI